MKRLLRFGPFLHGALTTTMKQSGNPQCQCAVDEPVHDAALLTWKEDNRTRTLYVPVEDQSRVQAVVPVGLRRTDKARARTNRKE